MADGSVVFATELDIGGVTSALRSFGNGKVKVPTITVPAEVGEDGLLATLDKIGYKAGTILGEGIKLGIAAVGAISTGAIALVTKSLGNTKELEQNLGGSEAVFSDYAKTIQRTGQKAFKLLGLSQSDYLATANQMGSLFKGLGYDAEEAASITMDAMQRAADVASIMGIDTSWAMESIAGAAKGNFTMMDNLGVAINDTTLANYALEKGIKKSVSKMSTQEKVALALEMFMEKTAYATGQYAKENDTLAGSLTTLGAAWDNFLAGTGETSVDDLVWALSNAADVITAKLQELMPRLKEELPALIEKLTPVLSELLTTVMPSLTKMIVAIIPPIASALGEAAKALAPALFEGLLSGLVGDENAKKVISFIQKLFNPEIATGEGVQQTAFDLSLQNAALQEEAWLFNPPDFMAGAEANSELNKAAGKKVVSDFVSGMDENAALVDEKSADIGNRVYKGAVGAGERTRVEGAAEAATEAEGEGEMNPLAQRIIEDVIAGLEAGTPQVSQGVQSSIDTAQSSVETSGFNEVGKQIVAGMAAGVRSNSGILAFAVAAVVTEALLAAKKAAKIKSPSRLFRDEIGAMLTAGTAAGVESNSFMVRKAVNAMVADSIPDMRKVGNRAATLLRPYNAQGVIGSAKMAAMGNITQTNNFNVPYVTPDEVANKMLEYATYGLDAEG